MQNKKIILIIAALVLLAVLFVLTSLKLQPNQNQNNTPDNPQASNGIILFYGNGCPHCEIVEKFINDNKPVLTDKVKFDMKEVYNNKNNAEILANKTDICQIPSDQVGVPFRGEGGIAFFRFLPVR